MKIIAHRGASGEYPENSLLAFEQAIVQGADAIELDVHFHAPSNCFVVIHDHFVDNVTQKNGDINHFSLTALTALTIGCAQHIPTLAQALHYINGRVLVNLEIKTVPQSTTELNALLTSLQAQLTQAQQQFNFSPKQILLSSFDHQLMIACQRFMPQYAVAALIAHNPVDMGESLISLNIYAVNPAIDCLSADLITHLSEADIKIWVYTVDREEDILRCLALNVDGIFTNFPKHSRKVINEFHARQINN
ncbi:glycerophosphodiester phosphodiesterase [Thalassotalea sp. 1_MG-2023]|uniref:glycerophosphodiester phosphodiesterase n=1 Tax=Thalassotalea sp. 1_MG-2023 TaxID=3062680 RepID=UPI0026E25D2C|nr:glycerophosphodiester phosphodiesterase [Thalassotalea sp. 1_MG-2023]MDO6425612.1 glycerophosphodiester phosphodiesterase [Thalassotalea sp. 1_MG-2023]